MGVLGSIFGSDKAIKAARDTIDSVVFTPEERARHFLEVMKGYHPFRRAQRVLAFTVFYAYVGVFVYSIVMLSVGIVSDKVQLMDGAIKIFEMNNDTLGPAFVMISAFYFGGGMLESLKRVRK